MISTFFRRPSPVRSTFRFAAVLLGFGAICAPATQAVAADLDVRVYDSPEGDRYFAASFAAVEAPSRPAGMDVVIVADTSASQVGPFRETTLAAVEACLASLHPQDRVELIAADLDAELLTEMAAAPGSPQITTALDALRGVTPLGASQLRQSIEMAADRLASREGDRHRAILYVGDGFSMDAVKLTGRWAQTAGELRRDRVAVSCFAVGPQRNAHLLAALANYTGGNLYMDDPGLAEDDAEAARRGSRVGRVLADWAHAEVVWPESASANEAVLAAYPTEMPPLRSDRDSIVIGRLKSDVQQLVVDALADDESLAWSAAIPAPSEENAYLATLVSQASRDGGLSLTTLGEAGLLETARVINLRTDQLARVAQQAAAMGDLENARTIKQAVLKRDPGNLQVKPIQQSTGGDGISLIRTAQLEIVEAAPIENLVAPSTPFTPTPADSFVPQGGVVYEDQGYYPPSGVVVDGRFLSSVDRNRRVFAQLLEKEVANSIAGARDTMANNPEQATQSLKLMLQSVERAPELVASVRAGLIDKLQSALREAARQAIVKDELDRQRQANLAAARERELLLDRMAQDRERMKQLVERFNALIDERNFDDATEVTLIMEELDRTGVVPTVARVWGEQKRYHELNQELRNRRAAMFIETLAQVEISAMPFPDNVPMVYPDAETWRQLTAARAKYKSVDVAGESESEKAITKALTEQLPVGGLDFPEGTPLEEVIDYLRDEYEITIVLDTPALDDLGLGPDEPINVNLRNVSLRAAMRRMLSPLELTYVIDDEVLLITTEEAALSPEYLQVKVYPVADLVIPIPAAQPGGGAGLGGGGGGGGGGLGGGGGGGLGGGGGGGGGLGGGGGGAFSVPDATPATGPRTLTLNSEAAPVSNPTPSATSKSTSVRSTAAGEDLWLPQPSADTSAWEAVVVSEEASVAAVRSATARLMKQKRYSDVTELVSAAIRAGKQQAWMYESLGIAMRLAGADQSAIERAILSAADLSAQPDQLVAIADYLAGMNLNRRAVQVYRMALAQSPTLQELLGPALAAAKRSGDTESLRWVTAAIAERAWPNELQVIADEGRLASKALLANLDAQGEARLAERYRAELADAERRDCLVRVTWAGDADLDLAVREPSGAVCWAGADRTAGGGMRIEASNSDANATVHTETYVCARGFAGDYQALVSKVYGDVVANAVTIEITVAAGTEAETTQKRQVKLDDQGKALANFNNPVGRRAEPIADGQLAEALRRQESVTRSVLSQQLSSMSDEGLVSLRPDERRRLRAARAGSGSVGFQPQITVLPEGTNLGVSAVVSSDRRYVRVSPTPIFSVIGDIAQFSFSGAGVDPTAQTAQFAGAQADPVGFGLGGGGAGGAGGGGGGLGGGIGGGGGGGIGGGGGGGAF